MEITMQDVNKAIRDYKIKNGYTPKLKEWTVKNGFPCNKETLLNHFGKYNDILKQLGYETYSYGKRRYNKTKMLEDLKKAILKYRTSNYMILRQEGTIVYRYVYEELFGSYANAIEKCGITKNKMYLIEMYKNYNLEDEFDFLLKFEFDGKLTDKQVIILEKCKLIKDSEFTRNNVCKLIGTYKVYHIFKNFSLLCIMANKTIKGLFKRQHKAEDGHICDSYEECMVDNFLYKNNIKHKTQVQYPNSKYKCDFVVNNIFIEYTKFKNNDLAKEKYIKTLKEKRKICKENNITLIEIDDISNDKLNSLLQRLLSEMIIE